MNPTHAAPLDEARSIWMCDPTHFDVAYVINPHMAEHVGGVDRALARQQWEHLKDAFEHAGLPVTVLPAVAGLPDLCFAANQTFPLRDTAGTVVRSKMAAPQRRREVDHVAEHWQRAGHPVVELDSEGPFEAGGDGLWYPGRRLILAGVGPRSTREAWDEVSRIGRVPVVPFELVHPRYYHLDTCLCPLDPDCALYVPEAFTDQGIRDIRRLFPEAEPLPSAEAQQLAANGVAIGRHFFVQANSPVSRSVAAARGFTVVEVETSEFLKSGGSVTCLHLRF